jgi:hypothetical protein
MAYKLLFLYVTGLAYQEDDIDSNGKEETCLHRASAFSRRSRPLADKDGRQSEKPFTRNEKPILITYDSPLY